MTGLSECTYCSRVDGEIEMWNHDSWTSPYGIGLSPTFDHNNAINVKVGVIGMGFSALVQDVEGNNRHPHVSLRERVSKVHCLENIGDCDDQVHHGNHVAGLIGATESTSVRMRGVCTNVELLLYSMPCGNYTWIEYPHISHLINCLSQMIWDSVKVVNISLEWRMDGDMNTDDHVYIDNMLYGFQTVLKQQDWHFVVSAKLDNYSSLTGREFNFFSALAAFVPDRITMVGASDMFGHNCSFSNHGTVVSLSAPGEHILSTVSTPDGYGFLSGTSQSSALVAAAVVLLKKN